MTTSPSSPGSLRARSAIWVLRVARIRARTHYEQVLGGYQANFLPESARITPKRHTVWLSDASITLPPGVVRPRASVCPAVSLPSRPGALLGPSGIVLKGDVVPGRDAGRGHRDWANNSLGDRTPHLYAHPSSRR